jgi:hypothetical protein
MHLEEACAAVSERGLKRSGLGKEGGGSADSRTNAKKLRMRHATPRAMEEGGIRPRDCRRVEKTK